MKNKNTYLGLGALVVVAALAWVALRLSVPGAAASATVELNDGDSYTLVMDEVRKTIAGTTHTMLAYNGSIPGPTIAVRQGATITIEFKNNTDAPTMLHSHGVRADNASDGSQTTQKEIAPGATYTYTLTFPDAGVYWYHPHVRDDRTQELGAYGAFLVKPAREEYWSPANKEEVLFLDDILIENGAIDADTKTDSRLLMGRYGGTMLTNGSEQYVLNAQKGAVVRLYLINAANARPFNFSIEGTRLKLIGGDNGAYEQDSWQDSVLLNPSERAIVDVYFGESGSFALKSTTPGKAYKLGTVEVSDVPVGVSYRQQFDQLMTHQEIVQSIDPFRPYFAAAPDKRIALTVDMMGMGSHMGHSMPGMAMGEVPQDGIEWEEGDMAMMNRMAAAGMVSWNMVDMDSGKKNMDIDWTFKKDQPVKIRIFNDPNSAHPMQHPIHFHGQRFLVVARDDVAQTNLVWKDTVLVRAGETVDIVLDPSNPGVWMAHCHILEHIEAGMMLTYTVK